MTKTEVRKSASGGVKEVFQGSFFVIRHSDFVI